MRILGELKAHNRWLGFVLFWVGPAILYFCYKMQLYNVLTNAAALVWGLGGEVQMTGMDKLVAPSITILQGGAIGYEIARDIGWFIFLIQVVFWVADDLGSLETPAKVGMAAVFVFDFVTAMFFLLGGTAMVDLAIADPARFTVRVIISLFMSIVFLSLGTPFWMALGFEIMRSNKDEGLGGLGDIASAIRDMIVAIFRKLAGVKGSGRVSSQPSAQRPRPEMAFGGGNEHQPVYDYSGNGVNQESKADRKRRELAAQGRVLGNNRPDNNNFR